MFLALLKKAVPVPKLTKYSNYVFVGPHPDDIEVSSGATVAALTGMGKKVTFIIATNGCVGGLDKSCTTSQLIKIRQAEAINSAKLLGVTDVVFLPFDDGCGYSMQSLTEELAKHFLQLKPDVVFCPDHTVRSECHPDHLNVGKAATDACFIIGWEKLTQRLGLDGSVVPPIIAYYYTDSPTAYVKVSKTYKQHIDAIKCHKSQFTEDDIRTFCTYFSLRQRRFGLMSGSLRADGYRTLSTVHQHCFPEASEF